MKKEYQPKTGQVCSCKKGVQRDNCPRCEGTGMVIDFKAIRDRKNESTLSRIEKLMMKEDETQVGTLETPIQSPGATPEAKDNKDVKPEKEEEKKEEKKDEKKEADPAHAEFMKSVKPVMDKVKAKQIVTWQELEQLQQVFDKIKE